eukprot:9645440-Alexandrium_andersonii.AAC.1
MSASLVGSEMCIRDRATSIGARADRRWPNGPSAAAHPRRTSSRSAGWSCLLYTSDAADDM